MIYLQIKILYSEHTFQSNPLLVTSSYNNYNTNFIYISKSLQTNKLFTEFTSIPPRHLPDNQVQKQLNFDSSVFSFPFKKKVLHFSVTNG